ncbi:MAG: CHAP domain-containing protein [Clostridiales bacterium]|nr:CHAP domain-containing protein [Clostridiales bacterium]
MRTGLKAYIEKIKADKVQKQRLISVLCVLSLFVAGGVFWRLRLIGITMSNDTYCGKIEHTHSDECIGEQILICGYEDDDVVTGMSEVDTYESEGTIESTDSENSENIVSDDTFEPDMGTSDITTADSDASGEHIHTDECYNIVYICEIEEHHHGMQCYSNPNADVESAADWEASLPSLTGEYGADVASVAESQLGYKESTLNYRLAEDGSTYRGYTRYGEWYGNPHGDWSAMFVAFCLNYAGIPDEAAPYNSGADAMYKHWTNAGLTESVEYMPKAGDIAFIDFDENGAIDHAAIVTGVDSDGYVMLIGGDIGDSVSTLSVLYGSADIIAYGNVGAAYERGVEAGFIEVKQPSVAGVTQMDDGSFIYEDDELVMKLYTAEQIDGITLTVYDLHEYLQTENYADDFDIEADARLIAKHIAAYRDGEEIDVASLGITAEIHVKDSVIEPMEAELRHEEAVPEAEIGVVLTPIAIVEEELVESESVLVPLGGDVPTVTMQLMSNDVIMRAARTVNANFTVQYYAYLNMIKRETTDEIIANLQKNGWNKGTTFNAANKVYVESEIRVGDLQKYGYLPIMDTSSKTNGTNSAMLPQNGKTGNDYNVPEIRGIYIGEKDTAHPNKPDDSEGTALRTKTLTEIYEPLGYDFFKAPNLSYFNSQNNNKNYILVEIWKLKKGGDQNSDADADWEKRTLGNITNINDIHFTNRAETAAGNPNYIYIENDDVIRLVFDTTESTTVNVPANFYDYNITSSPGVKNYTNIDGNAQGINSPDNYNGTGSKFAFGNANTDTGLGGITWLGNQINGANRAGGSYKLCTFGLASSKLGADGLIQPSNGVVAPSLFGDTPATGKTVLNGYSFNFERNGDTYTLSAVKRDGETVLDNLRKFNHPKCGDRAPYNHIYTNNFWPLDDLKYNGMDPLFGQYDKKVLYNTKNNGSDIEKPFADSDDGVAHNSFFGFDFAVDFELIGEYCGPLQYYFFGDDDMWVYLVPLNSDGTENINESQLVCDIGGVHSAVGEYVDLWDYIPKDGTTNNGYKAGKYRLKFFYTERGASGSTCYMRYTLPSVSNVPNDSETGSIDVSKLIEGGNSEAFNNIEFEFRIELTDENGDPLPNIYPSYIHYSGNDGEYVDMGVISDTSFKLKAGEHIKIMYLPAGARFKITEVQSPGFGASNTVDGYVSSNGLIAEGVITKNGEVKVVYTNVTTYELPSTGGPGTIIYTISGIMLMALPFIYGYRLRRKGERRQTK